MFNASDTKSRLQRPFPAAPLADRQTILAIQPKQLLVVYGDPFAVEQDVQPPIPEPTWRIGSVCRLTVDQLAELSALVTTGLDRARDGVVSWRRVDLQRVIEERFGVSYHERQASALLKRLGFSHVSARPRTPDRIRPS